MLRTVGGEGRGGAQALQSAQADQVRQQAPADAPAAQLPARARLPACHQAPASSGPSRALCAPAPPCLAGSSTRGGGEGRTARSRGPRRCRQRPSSPGSGRPPLSSPPGPGRASCPGFQSPGAGRPRRALHGRARCWSGARSQTTRQLKHLPRFVRHIGHRGRGHRCTMPCSLPASTALLAARASHTAQRHLTVQGRVSVEHSLATE